MVQHAIKHEPTFPLLQVQIAPGEVLVAEAGSMVARAAHVAMEVKLNAANNPGFLGKVRALAVALVRKLIGGETLFVNHFSSLEEGWVWLAPPTSGSILHIAMEGHRMLFSAGAYLASSGAVDLKVRFGGLRALLAKEGAFFIEASGYGDLWVTSYGAIEEVYCNGTYIVDTGHIVGFDASLHYSIRTPGGGAVGLLASGEGLVCEFSGQGKILIQTRNVDALVDWVTTLMPS